MVYFISGHLDLTEREFIREYVPQLIAAWKAGARFVVGDARGADTMAQAWLTRRGMRDVTVYHMFTHARNNVGDFITHGGFKSDDERDAAMTEISDVDIAWVRPGREISGTAKNIQRRINYGMG